MRCFVCSALLKCASMVFVCDSRKRMKLMRWEKILTRRLCSGLRRSEKEKSSMPHYRDIVSA